MSKCALVLPYFGLFKPSFQLFLESCRNNPSFDWFIITDSKQSFDYPDNVHVIYKSFDELKLHFQTFFDFSISLEKPYKLCDFKPAYGYIFKSLLKNYDYWGYCDCDLVWGSLETLLLPLFSKNYDKIFAAGHLTIYRNDTANNKRFMNSDSTDGPLYKQAFSTEEGVAFDEMNFSKNIHSLFIESNAKVFEEGKEFNIAGEYFNFRRRYFDTQKRGWRVDHHKANSLLVLDQGHLYRYSLSTNKQREEYLYVHYQMRDLEWQSSNPTYQKVLITPLGFVPLGLGDSVKECWRVLKTGIVFSERVTYLKVYSRRKIWAFRDRKRRLHDPYQVKLLLC